MLTPYDTSISILKGDIRIRLHLFGLTLSTYSEGLSRKILVSTYDDFKGFSVLAAASHGSLWNQHLSSRRHFLSISLYDTGTLSTVPQLRVRHGTVRYSTGTVSRCTVRYGTVRYGHVRYSTGIGTVRRYGTAQLIILIMG